MKKYMLDTNIFNFILDEKIDLEIFKDKGEFFVTHIQQDEINGTKNELRRKSLNGVFINIIDEENPTSTMVSGVSKTVHAKVSGKSVPTESAIWGVSKWGQARWGDGFCELIKTELDKLNGNKENNVQDALIAETSINNNYILITNDQDLLLVTKKFHGQCTSYSKIFD